MNKLTQILTEEEWDYLCVNLLILENKPAQEELKKFLIKKKDQWYQQGVKDTESIVRKMIELEKEIKRTKNENIKEAIDEAYKIAHLVGM